MPKRWSATIQIGTYLYRRVEGGRGYIHTISLFPSSYTPRCMLRVSLHILPESQAQSRLDGSDHTRPSPPPSIVLTRRDFLYLDKIQVFHLAPACFIEVAGFPHRAKGVAYVAATIRRLPACFPACLPTHLPGSLPCTLHDKPCNRRLRSIFCVPLLTS